MVALEPAEAQVVRLNFGLGPEGQGAEKAGSDGSPGTWRAVRARLRAADPAAFANWYDHLTRLGQDAGEVRLRAGTPFVGRYVETHLVQLLAAAIEAEFGPFKRLRIESSA